MNNIGLPSEELQAMSAAAETSKRKSKPFSLSIHFLSIITLTIYDIGGQTIHTILFSIQTRILRAAAQRNVEIKCIKFTQQPISIDQP